MRNSENTGRETEDASSGWRFNSTTRRSILAASAAGIGSVALTTPAIGDPGEQGPHLTTDRSSNSGVYTADGQFANATLTQKELEEARLSNSSPDEWETLTASGLPNTVHIHYTGGTKGADDASRLVEHLAVAQDHVHQYLKPPSEQEFVFILRPGDRIEGDTTGRLVTGFDNLGPGEDEIIIFLTTPSDHREVSSESGISDDYLDDVNIGYFMAVQTHLGSLTQFDTYRVSPRDSPWMSQGMRLYVASTYGKSSAPYLTDDRGSLDWAESTVNSGSVDWETVNNRENGLDIEAGPVMIEYISDEWGWKKTLDMYFSGLTADSAFSSVLGVTRAEFEVGLIDYMSERYGGTPPEGYDQLQTETPSGGSGGTEGGSGSGGLLTLLASLVVGATGGAAYYKRTNSPTQKKNTPEGEE